MNKVLLSLVLLGLLGGLAGAQYHAPMYIMGGYSTTSSLYWNGVWLADAQNQTMKHLTPGVMMYNASNGIKMDVDNKHIVYAARGTTSTSYSTFLRSGIYRIDPGAMTVQTVRTDTMVLYEARQLLINQDGDYVFNAYQRNPSTNYAVLKMSNDGSTITTLLDSTKLGWTTYPSLYGTGIDIDTGLYLFNLYKSGTLYYAVIKYDEANSTYTTFAGGPSSSNYAWYGYYSEIQQDFSTGYVQGLYSSYLYQLMPGSKRTTLTTIQSNNYQSTPYSSAFDLQSAPKKRIVGVGYYINPYHYSPLLISMENAPPYTQQMTNLDPNNQVGKTYGRYAYSMDFYRGRHIQTEKTGPKQWNIRFSCPSFPLKQYVAVIGMSGVRSPIPLADGRRINLTPDSWTSLSLLGLLKPFFDPGLQVLDKNGEQKGKLDLRLLPPLGGLPIWIAMAVIDPAAPNGIAYLPDTIVFRIP
jgi:hypothetical protein